MRGTDGQGERRSGAPDGAAKPCWHVISSDDLLALLRRVEAGENPEFVYLEEYVNAEKEEVDG